jgi:hypothetical protein
VVNHFEFEVSGCRHAVSLGPASSDNRQAAASELFKIHLIAFLVRLSAILLSI